VYCDRIIFFAERVPVVRKQLIIAATFLACGWLASVTPTTATEKDAGPSFTLIDQNAKSVTAADLLGKPTLIHFGFTHCPVVCPTTLFELAELMKDLGPRANQVNFVFVTVDPERDTPALLKQYVANFDERFIALGGTPDAVEAFAKGFNAAYAKVQQGDSYTIDHTVHGYLLDRDWIKQGTIYAGADSNRARVVAALKTLLDDKPLNLPKSARAQ
jgi:protein SCO1/2